MSKALDPADDLRVTLGDNLSDSYELSQVLLAAAGFDGALQLLTPAWERALGYGREELRGKTLADLMGGDPRGSAAAAAAILDIRGHAPVEVRMHHRDGRSKPFRLHRRYDGDEHMMYIVAEEIGEGGD